MEDLERAKLKGFLERFKYIERMAEELDTQLKNVLHTEKIDKAVILGLADYSNIENNIRGQIAVMYSEYDILAVKFNVYFKDEILGITEINTPTFKFEILKKAPTILIPKVILNCKNAIGVLEGIVSPITKEESGKLTYLRNELAKVSERLEDKNFEKNLIEAMYEYENAHFLASALISSKVILCALDKIPGKGDEERIRFLEEQGLIKDQNTDSKKFIIKAEREARNFFSHNLSAFARSSDAISLLGDAVKILDILSKVERVRVEEKKSE